MSSTSFRSGEPVASTSTQASTTDSIDNRRLARLAERHRERRISLMTTALFMIAAAGTFSFGHMLVFWH